MKEFNAEEVRIETASALEIVRPAQVERQYPAYIGLDVHKETHAVAVARAGRDWCEAHGVDYVFGLAKNNRLKATIGADMAQAKAHYEATGQAARAFKNFRYQTLKSWSCERRVIGRAEHLAKGENPRFVVTSLPVDTMAARALYEQLYCARGDMENRIKEQQLALFADRNSTHAMRSNQLRLYFSSFAYVLMQTLRRLGLDGTPMAKAQCDTIRLKLFKIGAHIRISVHRVVMALSESYPYTELFQRILHKLQRIPLRC